MSKTFVVQPLPLSLPEGRSELEFSLKDPGEVRAVAFVLRARERALIDLNRDMHALARGAPTQPEFDEVLTLFVECSRSGPMRRRRFLVLATGQEIGVPEDREVTFLGTAISQHTRQVAHVYEITAQFEDVMGVRTPKVAAVDKVLGPPPPDEAS